MESDHSNEEIDILLSGQEKTFDASAETHGHTSNMTSDGIRINTATNEFDQDNKSLHLQSEGSQLASIDAISQTIKERLEEQKDKIFAVKMEAENGEESPPNKYDATCSICLGTYQNRAFLDDCFHILFYKYEKHELFLLRVK